MSTDIAMGQAFDQAVNDLNNLISRRFASDRTIRIENTLDGRWIALTSHAQLFPATPHLDTVERFVRAFARKEGVTVDEESVVACWQLHEAMQHSRRVPDNVVPIRVEA